MTARQHAINVRTSIAASRSMHIIDHRLAPRIVCVKCGLDITPALKPEVPECPDYARRKAAKERS
jgi:hypothetical protein